MAPHSPQSPASDMFRPRLDEQINLKHPLVRVVNFRSASTVTAAPSRGASAISCRGYQQKAKLSKHDQDGAIIAQNSAEPLRVG